MKTWWAITFGVICGLLGSGVLLLVSSAPRGEAIQLHPPPSPAPLVVHVVGAVSNPGIFTLPSGSRAGDAVQAAGGFLPEADAQTLNLAAFVQDGERIWIPFQAKEIVPPLVTIQREILPSTPETKVDINTATQEELEGLPGIGPVTAQKIIAFRQENGPFPRIEDIEDVPGIGPATFARIKDLITVYAPP